MSRFSRLTDQVIVNQSKRKLRNKQVCFTYYYDPGHRVMRVLIVYYYTVVQRRCTGRVLAAYWA